MGIFKKKIKLTTNYTLDEVKNLLVDNIEPSVIDELGFHQLTKKAFRGQYMDNNFKIQQVIDYKNNMNPVVNGRIENIDKGAEILLNIEMAKPAKYVLNFMVSILILWILFETKKVLFDNSHYAIVVVLFSFLIIGLIVIYASFQKEKEDVIRNLCRLLKSKVSKT